MPKISTWVPLFLSALAILLLANCGRGQEARPLEAMTKFAVLDEPRMSTAWAVNVDRAVQWLGDNGFERLDGEQLPQWMQERIKAGDAYGSVVVLPRGKSPIGLFAGPEEEPLWLAYLRAGGRIVHAGDLPFNYAEPPNVEPVKVDLGRRGVSLLGLVYGWNSPYWGQGNLPTEVTEQGRAWGFEVFDGPITGQAVEAVTIPFNVYTVPATGKQGTGMWFKNVNPDLPWSGLVKILQRMDGNNDAHLRDLWRASHYIGQPVTIPPLPPPPETLAPQLSVATLVGGMRDRREWVRGERVALTVTPAPGLKIGAVRLDLRNEQDTVIREQVGLEPPAPGQPPVAAFLIDTSPYAYGDYELVLTGMDGDDEVTEVVEKVGIRHIPPEYFNFEVWIGPGSNPIRTDLEFADIAAHNMEVYLTSPEVAGVDACVRHGLGFSLRAHPDFLGGKQVTYEDNPEYYRHDNEGKPMGNPYTAGRPALGISHPEIVANATRSLREVVQKVAGVPAFRPYVLCNDDFSIYYGWDYSPHVLERFRAETGREAPRQMEKPAAFGAIPDDHPWVQWFRWTLININGAYNKAETLGCTQARADVRCGPIPGGMQIPLVQLWEPSQYPPYNFGEYGFNLLCSYYYNTYWQPIMTSTFWMEIGRMGNRDLPEWNMPDCFMTAGYTRNNLFHYLAGAVKGLAYFNYGERNDNTWPEFGRLGKMLQRIGPVQAALVPAQRDLGLLNSFTSNCFDPGHTLVQVYAYHNLVQGHFDVEPVAEEEILAGRATQYKAILLYNVQYLRQSVYDVLAKHAANGGLVLLDSTVPFDIPGAKRLNVDLGMGTDKTLPFPPEGAHVSTPGIRDYGHAERIAVIRKALSEYVRPRFECDDIKVAAWRLEAGGVPYTYFVNVHDGQEYMFCRERMGAGHPGSGSPEKVQEVRDWEAAEMAKGPYTAKVVTEAMAGRVPYDLVAMKRVPVRTLPDGRWELSLSMERFGGMLVAWLPEEVRSVTLTAPEAVRRGAPLRAAATIAGDRPIPGVLAVEFRLADPRGEVSPVSGVRQAREGRATFEWTPAVNDPPGNWTLTATELVTGKTSRRTIRVTE